MQVGFGGLHHARDKKIIPWAGARRPPCRSRAELRWTPDGRRRRNPTNRWRHRRDHFECAGSGLSDPVAHVARVTSDAGKSERLGNSNGTCHCVGRRGRWGPSPASFGFGARGVPGLGGGPGGVPGPGARAPGAMRGLKAEMRRRVIVPDASRSLVAEVLGLDKRRLVAARDAVAAEDVIAGDLVSFAETGRS